MLLLLIVCLTVNQLDGIWIDQSVNSVAAVDTVAAAAVLVIAAAAVIAAAFH